MKCSQCATEFDGKFCPECGAKAEEVPPIVHSSVYPRQQQDYQTVPVQPSEKKKKKKKLFFLRWWFILLAVIAIAVAVGKVKNAIESRIDWKDIELIDVIPTPPSKTGVVFDNSDEEFRASLDGVSDADYNKYLKACIDSGFELDADKSSSSYKAYNEAGYALDMSHIGAGLSISLKAPMQLGTIRWPSGTAGSLLPTPKSTTGKFSFEYDNSFCVYVGDTSKADYDDYVAACVEAGFDVDYNKGDTYYYACNVDGWDLTLKYEGNSTMFVRIDEPYEEAEESEETEPDESTQTEAEPTEETASAYAESDETETALPEKTAEAVNTSGIDPDFKAAMDAYEAFYVEYCDFMKKYSENPDDLTLIIKYGVMLDKMAEMDEAFCEWDEADMNDEELKYYLDVNNRVMKMLVDAGEW